MSLMPSIGAIAGWRVVLTTTQPAKGVGFMPAPTDPTFSSTDYRGSIDVSMVSGLDPGRFTVTVEDITDSDYKKLVETARTKTMLAGIYASWLDVRSPTAGFGTEPPIAVVRVTSLRRRAGQWRYELVIDGREWVIDRLLRTVAPVNALNALDAAQQIAEACKVEYEPVRAPAGGNPPTTEQRRSGAKELARDALLRLGEAMVAEAAAAGRPRGGLGMYLIRGGKLLMGPDRLSTVKSQAVNATNGLLAIERSGSMAELEGSEIKSPDAPEKRRDLFTLTLRGRPDLRPGDVIDVAPPEVSPSGEELGFALGTASPGGPVSCYIQEVNHRLTREQGFLTTVHCVAADQSPGKPLVERLWFPTIVADLGPAAGSAEARLADRWRKRDAKLRWPDVAQVRSHFVSGNEPPAQTEKLRRGTLNPDHETCGAARLMIDPYCEMVPAAPYARPFAWGKFGLVVPRYPGTRVVLLHRNGDPEDPIDIGAVWERGTAPDAQAGDWWLSLPAEIAAANRTSVEDEQEPAAPSGKASNDLIDADGKRVIAVGKLTIKVGDSALLDAGTRPTVSDLPVSIEHSSGAKITIDQDGAITIEAKKALTLKAAESIVLDTPRSVEMHVGSAVEISKRT